MSISEVAMALADLSVLCSFVYYVWHYKKLSAELKAFSWFVVILFITQAISMGFWLADANNMPLLHFFYVPFGFIAITYFYYTVLKTFISPYILVLALFFFLTFTVINSIYFQSIYTYNSYALSAEAVIVLILSLSTYTLHLNHWVKVQKKDTLVSLNWINSGLFIYFTSDLLLFYFGKTLMHTLSPEYSRHLWNLHSLFFILMNCCFLVGLWKFPKK
ncbi:MAG: hypothetical protein CL843_16135 [Crocinitomicaceae bacterium]|nr:hypothetical protein [Crocinitomicaceae bacterium]|tara:strand:+ start:1789 stop:2442 length:654 start_codon:yes stop_codon:yes gene_type:complete